MTDILNLIKNRDPEEKEFHQAVEEVIDSVQPVLDRNPQYRKDAILERITEPECTVDMHLSLIIHPGNSKHNHAFRLRNSFQYSMLAVLWISV